MKTKFLMAVWAGLAVLCAGMHGQSAAAPALKVGDPAPEIKEVTWVQGTPVTGLKPGHVYVFEFWATWCGPCIYAMPHLSELAKQYAGKVTFVGVSILEDNHGPKGAAASLEKVNTFMQKNPGRMTYNVCVDGGSRQSYMAATWFRATGQSGIPCSVVVNGEGKVAWIGHPMQLDEVLPRVLEGGLDVAKFDAEQKAKREQAQSARRARQALTAPLRAVLAKKDYAEFAKQAESLVQEHPEVGDDVADMKTQALVESRDEKSLRVHLAALEQKGRAGFISMEMAKMLADGDGWQKETYAACAHYMDFVLQHSFGLDRDPSFHAATARHYFRAGDYPNAVARQQRALDTARRESRVGPDEIKKQEDTLARYRDAAQGP